MFNEFIQWFRGPSFPALPRQATPSQPSPARPSSAKPRQIKPNRANQTNSSQAKPGQARPGQAKPSQAKPCQSKPSQPAQANQAKSIQAVHLTEFEDNIEIAKVFRKATPGPWLAVKAIKTISGNSRFAHLGARTKAQTETPQPRRETNAPEDEHRNRS